MALFHKISGIWKKSDSFYRLPAKWVEVKNFWCKTTQGWKPIWTYSWETGDWSDCSELCGGGIQTRSVICRRSDGFAKPDSFCSELLSKPASSQACNTQPCLFDVNVGDQVYKCFVTEKSGLMNVSLANARTIGSEAYGDATNWNWPYPIVINNPYTQLTPPLTINFLSKWNARFSDRSIIGYLKVDTNLGRILDAETAQKSGCCVDLNKTIVLNYIPTILTLYFQMWTSKSDQHMAMYLSNDVSRPMIKCTDANGAVVRHY